MDIFLSELELLLEWAQSNEDITEFEEAFKKLVYEHRNEEGVMDISNIVAHNYRCHKYNRLEALMHNTNQWKRYIKEA